MRRIRSAEIATISSTHIIHAPSWQSYSEPIGTILTTFRQACHEPCPEWNEGSTEGLKANGILRSWTLASNFLDLVNLIRC